MTSSNNIFEYLNIFSPSEVKISSEDIFYREEYTEIINYLKLLLTDSKDLDIFEYMTPRGTLLLNINSGSEVLDYIRLISSNYYLNLIELNFFKISKNPEDFMQIFNQLFDEIINLYKKGQSNEENKENIKIASSEFDLTKKTLVIIEEKKNLQKLFSNKLIDIFVNLCSQNPEIYNLISNNIILVWINYKYEDIANNYEDIIKIFDLFIRIPLLKEIERETLLHDFAEQNAKISFDIHKITELTEGWEVLEIKKLLNVGILKHYLNSDLNMVSNEITAILIQLIKSGEVISSNKYESKVEKKIGNGREKNYEKLRVSPEDKGYIFKKENNSNFNDLIQDIRDSNYSDFMKEQLYEHAASKNYSELTIIIDKLDKGEELEANDRKILSQYPFILNEIPSKAQLNLEKGKKRIDIIKKSLGQ